MCKLKKFLSIDRLRDKLAWTLIVSFVALFGLFLRIYFVTHYSPYFLWGGDPTELHAGALGIKGFLKGDLSALGKPFALCPPLDEIFQRGPVYPTFLALIYLFGKVDFQLVGIVQAILDTLSILLIFFIAAKLFQLDGHTHYRIGFFAALIYAFYGPAIYSCGYILTETFCTFAVLLAVAGLLFVTEQRSKKLLFLAGLILTIPCLTRPNLQFLGLFLIPSVTLLVIKENRRTFFFYLLAGHLLLFGSWFVISIYAGHPLLFGQGTGPNELYGGLNIEDESWFTDRYNIFPKPRAELLETNDLFKASLLTITRQPFASAHLIIEKIYWLWFRPYNYFKYPYPFPGFGKFSFPELLRIEHQILVILAFSIVILMLLENRRSAPNRKPWLLFLPIIYVSLINGLSISQVRYNLPFMPLLIIMSSYALFKIPKLRKIHFRWELIFFIIAMFIVWFVPQRVWLGLLCQFLPSSLPASLNFTRIFFIYILFIILLLYIQFIIYRNNESFKYGKLLIFAWSFFLPAFIFLARDFKNPDWKEWFADLSKPEQSIEQEIIIPANLKNIFSAEQKAILIDMYEINPESFANLEIYLNNQLVRKDIGHISIDKSKFLPVPEASAQLRCVESKQSPPKLMFFPLGFDLQQIGFHTCSNVSALKKSPYLSKTELNEASNTEAINELSYTTQEASNRFMGGVMHLILERRGWRFANIRQWVRVPIENFPLGDLESLNIMLKITEPLSRDYVLRIAGDYPDQYKGKYFDGPAWGLNPDDTSMFKWFNLEEYRLRRLSKIHGEAGRSAYFDGVDWSSRDLSPALGQQFGRYRIYLWAKDEFGNDIFL